MCPVPHLQGMIAAAREVREWAAGLIAEYQNAVRQATAAVPDEITAHVTALQSQLAQADSQLRFGTDLVGQISQGQATAELHEQAENTLWQALEGLFLPNQAVAMPELLRINPATRNRSATASAPRQTYRDQRVQPRDLWRIASPSARAELRGTEFGEEEMQEMCEKLGGILTAGAQRYLDEVEAAVARGDARFIVLSLRAGVPRSRPAEYCWRPDPGRLRVPLELPPGAQ